MITGCRVNELTSLQFDQFQETEKGNHLIVIRDSKTHAGKREVPIPKQIMNEEFIAFVKSRKEKNAGNTIFKYASRDGKGSGNAVGKKFSRHLAELKINRGKLVFHSLRKFLNDHFLKNEVKFEPRCQFFGHEIDNVNVATYANKFGVDNLAEHVGHIQFQLLLATGIIRTKF